MDIILTRYLYVKDEVVFSLWKSILLKNIEESLFWGYELYFSGFQEEVLLFLIQMYYDFYYPLNIRLENRLHGIASEWLKDKKQNHLLGEFIENIVRRDCFMDGFIVKYCIEDYDNTLMKQHELFEDIVKIISCNTEESFINWFLEFQKNTNLSANVLKTKLDNINTILCAILPENNEQNNLKLLQILKSLAISYLFNIICEPKKDKKMYMKFSNDDINEYKNMMHINGKSRTMIQKAHRFQINIDCKYLFNFSRKNQSQEDYYEMINNWLYYASKSPLWETRITRYNGVIDHDKKTVIFNNDDDLDNFHNFFGYELDEQPQVIQPVPSAKFTNDCCIIENFVDYNIQQINLL